MTLHDRIQTLKSRLFDLRRRDAGCAVFGSERHRYALNPVKTNAEIANFEKRFGIVLPEGYRLFLTTVGNGGAGPYYGLEPLENGLFLDLERKRLGELLDPSKPFPFTEPWNLAFDPPAGADRQAAYQLFEERYSDAQWVVGLLRICNFGCGISMNLVVNGREYGNIWIDGRCNDSGIYPDRCFKQVGRTDFLTWYELWLDKSLKEVQDKIV